MATTESRLMSLETPRARHTGKHTRADTQFTMSSQKTSFYRKYQLSSDMVVVLSEFNRNIYAHINVYKANGAERKSLTLFQDQVALLAKRLPDVEKRMNKFIKKQSSTKTLSKPKEKVPEKKRKAVKLGKKHVKLSKQDTLSVSSVDLDESSAAESGGESTASEA